MDRKYKTKREWYLRNYDKVIARRRHSLLDGKWRGLSKRLYPGHCELCGKSVNSYLHYHHWDDNEPSIGMWLCAQCHRYAEGFDKAMIDTVLFDTYIESKLTITRQCYQARLL